MFEEVEKEILKYSKKEYIRTAKYFHKTNEGQYASGDEFLGISVPNLRIVAKKWYDRLDYEVIDFFIKSKFHEYRLFALIVLVYKVDKQGAKNLEEVTNYYLANTKYINGWDLVDLSAPYIIGKYILLNEGKKDLLYFMAKSNSMWEQRIAIVSNWMLIRSKKYEVMLNIADMLIESKEDLIQKAVGWMLREIGKRDFEVEYNFLVSRYLKMPRTMLRYSLEKFEESLRLKFLKGEI